MSSRYLGGRAPGSESSYGKLISCLCFDRGARGAFFIRQCTTRAFSLVSVNRMQAHPLARESRLFAREETTDQRYTRGGYRQASPGKLRQIITEPYAPQQEQQITSSRRRKYQQWIQRQQPVRLQDGAPTTLTVGWPANQNANSLSLPIQPFEDSSCNMPDGPATSQDKFSLTLRASWTGIAIAIAETVRMHITTVPYLQLTR